MPEAYFVHAGTGPLGTALSQRAQQLGVANRIRWLGYRPDVRDVLEACDVYVQPSWCEAHPFSLLEAGAAGLPVVATDVGGQAEILDEGAAGLLVPARQPEALAGAVIRTLRSPGLRRELGGALRTRIATAYNQARMVDATFAVYDRLLSDSPPPRAR